MSLKTTDAVALTWAQRAQAELGAKARFIELTNQLIDARASKKVIDLSRKAIIEEDQHSDLCADMAIKLGHPTGYALFQGTGMQFKKPWEERSSYRERLLCEMVLMCCITETINASLLNTIYGSAKNTEATRLIQKILRDEIKHSQMGWAHLSLEAKKIDCSFLGQYLDSMLKISVKDELFVPAPHLYEEGDFQYGVMPVQHRLGQFIETLEAIVLPGFEKIGIDTSKAHSWLQNKTETRLHC